MPGKEELNIVADIPGPHLEVRQPARRAPAGSCDCHVHVFGQPADVELSALRDYTPHEATLEQCQRMHAVLGFERVVIVQPSPYGTNNAYQQQHVRKLGENARGVAVVDMSTTDATLEQLYDDGFRASRMNLVNSRSSQTSAFNTIAERIRPLGWHLEICVRAHELRERVPGISGLAIDTVIDHMGIPDPVQGPEQEGFQALLELLKNGKTWVKLSGPYHIDVSDVPWPKANPFARALISAAPDRCIWGSDWPHPHTKGPMPNDGDLFDQLLVWTEGDENLLQKILVHNPAQLYGFDQ
jgi:predicted TIM-barrel fold metal-dependent hydrolase